ncbi:murein biosynthesis integral membrane protein MurJ [Rhodococcus kronopolitis]|uniref:Murein biosynthesis integral membrane protein MurJ n=1 Tax=Rhodococcus kronopolitis TaxID=1460226 RepID=A0ABV9FUA9_9NOCA
MTGSMHRPPGTAGPEGDAERPQGSGTEPTGRPRNTGTTPAGRTTGAGPAPAAPWERTQPGVPVPERRDPRPPAPAQHPNPVQHQQPQRPQQAQSHEPYRPLYRPNPTDQPYPPQPAPQRAAPQRHLPADARVTAPPRPATAVAARPAPDPAAESDPPHLDPPDVDIADGAESENSGRSLMAATGSIAVATLVSRITGFLKQVLLLTTLGAVTASSFTVASQLPNMISELVLGAVLSAIVVPVLVRAEKEDDDGGAAFVRRLFTIAGLVLGVAAVAAVAGAPLLVRLFLPEDGEVDPVLTTRFAYLLLPAILFYGLSALLTAILNTRGVFKPGAWAPVLNNCVVLVVLGMFWVMSRGTDAITTAQLLVLGIGVTLGVVTQAACLLPAIRREGISLKPLWGLDARLRLFAGMGVAIVLYVLISQVGFSIGTRIAAGVDGAGPVIYNQAWILLQLPYGILGVTVLTAIMPRLSRNAAAEDTPAVVDDLSVATRLTMVSLVPVVVFMTFAGPQIGQALFGYGKFGPEDAERLGHAVSWSAFTLIPYALVLIHLRVFYAREQAWTPTWIILGITSVKVGLSLLAPVVASDDSQVVSLLGVANGLGFTAGAVIGAILLHRSLGALRMANVGKTAFLVVVASLAGSITMLTAEELLGLDSLSDRFGGPGAFVQVGICAVIMLGVTFTLLRFAGIPEVVAGTVALTRLVNRVRGRSPQPAGVTDAAPITDTGAMPIYYDDAATVLLPAFGRSQALQGDSHQLPYPGPGRTGTPNTAREGSDRMREGVRMSDEDVAGKSGGSTAQATTRGSATRAAEPTGAAKNDPSVTTGEPTKADVAESKVEARPQARPANATRKAPERDLVLDTGVIPIGSPPLPPMRIGAADASSRQQTRGPKLIAGASVAGGRYRLLAPHGGARGLKFWQAHDIKLDREVALTFVDSEQRASSGGELSEDPQAVLSRTLRLGRINSPGLARVLDVVRGSSGGIVVAEWTPGRSLKEMAETAPSPIGAARAIRALASAAEAAHRGGGALSIDHPDRVRISVAGDAVLAFPATLADADAPTDVQGLGAMLYALITARWPLGDPGSTEPVGGMPPADRGNDGQPLEPRLVRPEVPFEISAVANRALEQGGGIRTAATVQHVLDQASVVDQKTDLMPALRLGQRPPGATGHALSSPEHDAAARLKSNRMVIALAGLGVLTVIVLAFLGWWLANTLAGGGSTAPLTEQNIGLTTTSVAEPTGDATAPAPAAAPVAVVPAGAAVYSPQGSPDNPATAGQAVDGNPATKWSTDTYLQQFPSFKNGIGLMVNLAEPSALREVWIDSPSAGTTVEIRTAPDDNSALDQTQVIGTAVLGKGVTTVPVTTDGNVGKVLVWITKLAEDGGKNQSSIAEVGFTKTP